MKVLLVVLHYGLLKNFESVVAQLASEGHEVVLAAEEAENLGGLKLAEELARGHRGVSLVHTPALQDDPLVELSRKLRVTLDYLRFIGPEYAEFPKLRERMDERVPAVCLRALGVVGRRPLTWMVGLIEQAMPPHAMFQNWLTDLKPDIVLFGSLTHYRSAEPDMLRAAIGQRLRTVACVYSWDHLSSKALLRDFPDAVFVWNEIQRKEALTLHALPASRVVVTGAQCYDQWFGRQPFRDRETFCHDMGLDSARPFLLYVCSALTPSPNEPAFVVQWIERLRSSDDPRLREIGVLVRPHPERLHEWEGTRYQHLENVTLRGGAPIDADAKNNYFDALWHASAVVGLVTSAFLDAAIVGRPVLTVTLPQFAMHQEGMLHFRYLLEVEGGLMDVAHGLDEHVVQLAAVLRDVGTWRRRQERFLRAFVRPGGLDTAATPEFVRQVENVAKRPATGRRRRTSGRFLETFAPAFVRWAHRPTIRRLLRDRLERDREAFEQERAAYKTRVEDEKVRSYAAKARIREGEASRREAEIRQKELEKAGRLRQKQRHLRHHQRAKWQAKLRGRLKRLVARGSGE